MNGTRRRSTLLVLLVGFFLAGTGAALAFWTVTVANAGNNPAIAKAASLSAPSAPTVSVLGSGSIRVGWTLPGSQLTGAQYLVTRSSGPGSPSTVCQVSAPTVLCTDSGLTAG